MINNSLVFEQTKRDSLTDPLTGLPNTRFMFGHLTRELARAERLGSEVSLLVLDLDEFKEINDTLRPPRRRSRAARGGPRAAQRHPPVRHLRPLRRATSSSWSCRAAAPTRRAEAARAAGGHRGDLVRGTARAAGALGSSFGSASFPHDGRAYEALLASADGGCTRTRRGGSSASARARPRRRRRKRRRARCLLRSRHPLLRPGRIDPGSPASPRRSGEASRWCSSFLSAMWRPPRRVPWRFASTSWARRFRPRRAGGPRGASWRRAEAVLAGDGTR